MVSFPIADRFVRIMKPTGEAGLYVQLVCQNLQLCQSGPVRVEKLKSRRRWQK